MGYKITEYTKKKALQHNVLVENSKVKGKKIDVFNSKGEKLASVGAVGYNDYPTFLFKYGKEYADERRRLYKIRHEKDRHVKGSAGYWADILLW